MSTSLPHLTNPASPYYNPLLSQKPNMNKDLENSINQFGGKNGILNYFKNSDAHPEVSSTILPSIILSIREEFTQAMFEKLKILCSKECTRQVTIRSSEKSDLDGMVDVFPTSQNVELNFKTIKDTIKEIRKRCESDNLKTFAEKEGANFDPQNASISLAPQMHQDILTVTQHPNQKDVYYFDTDYNIAMSFPKLKQNGYAEEAPYFRKVMEII
ncbi:hypothetical protein KJ632_01545, partial [Patescibacteria group bacterium]|nr:hypothetical protein [Patescibacteria group bacterium]